MLFIRSLVFNIFFYLWTALIVTVFLPCVFLPKKDLFIIGKVWAEGIYQGLKLICNLKVEVRGRENLPEAPYIVASKHQSALETIMFWTLFPITPTYILKKELLKLPLYGLYLKKMGMIAIDRGKGASALKDLIKKTKLAIAEKKIIIIFPEGTRTAVGTQTEYQPGIAALYSTCNVPIIPVALNTGVFWPKNSFIRKPGKFIIEFLPRVEQGLSKEEFLKHLQNTIESTGI